MASDRLSKSALTSEWVFAIVSFIPILLAFSRPLRQSFSELAGMQAKQRLN
jgi:hypothetical protein